jgi:inner membrane transporter RhtA
VNHASTPRFSPVWLVLVGILSVQFGAVVSKGLFDEIPPVGMVFLRLITSSLILLAFVRPRLRGRPVTDWWPVLALGFALGAMNWSFYESFARIPLGVAATIEFVGPLSLARSAAGGPRLGVGGPGRPWHYPVRRQPNQGRRRRVRSGAARRRLLGAVHRRRRPRAPLGRRRGLAVASTVATLAIAPFAVVAAGERLLEPRLLVLGRWSAC